MVWGVTTDEQIPTRIIIFTMVTGAHAGQHSSDSQVPTVPLPVSVIRNGIRDSHPTHKPRCLTVRGIILICRFG